MHVGWEVAPAMAATYHEPQWHMPQIKAEIQDMPISEGFHSGDSSLSRDSHPNSPQSVDSGDQLYQDNNPYNTVLQYRHSMQFNPLTPPGFDHPKLINYHVPYHMKSNMHQYPIVSPAYRHKDISNNLTPSYTPPLNVTPPKSPRSSAKTPDNTAHSDSGDNENCDNLQRMDMLQDNMKESSNDSGDEAKSDVEDESELRTPRVNSHGKVKTFKCKQCEFVAVTKMDFWEHSKVHIKPEKMLKCLRCPFVTEYKHHLEYHLRNHAGSKPFQCDKCNYNCVNKSMLNSHLKSHSNIYQYRCSECNYATKYCHSLKLHLRKYSHKPAMVLNQDGTPNPLPIIDVYGTRRGPKTRHNPKESESSDVKRANSPQMSAQLPVYQNPFTTMGQAPFDFPYPYGQLLNSFPNIPNFMFNNNIEPPISPEKPKSAPAPENLSPKSKRQSPEYLAPAPVDPPVEIPESALDLTQMKPEIQLPINVPTPATPTVNAKSRRKGRAFKLDRIAAMNQSLSSDDEHDSRIKIPKVSPTTSTEIVHRSTPICENRTIAPVNRVSPPPDCPRTPTKTPEVSPKPAAKVSTESYECKYCEIAFRDPVLYTIHMGYHGYKDAFTCNMCGEECCDRISFFLHIARNSHV